MDNYINLLRCIIKNFENYTIEFDYVIKKIHLIKFLMIII